ncbi:MAG TPA: twin-arginine translocase TatA/TatE family subunit [Verrucomicrobiae bacterium]|nr:twin-arginine translocase TatA/TatE family subunit [Verrucomicrobiae bacterium]
MDGMELLIIGVVAIVIIMWGPGKIPEFAKALGRAKGEFEKASKEYSVTTTANVAAPATMKTKDEILVDTAKSFGISTDGKSRQQISDEISSKAKLLGSD